MKTIIVGKIRKPQGLKGELELLSFSGDYTWLENAEILILAPNPQSPVPTPVLKEPLFNLTSYRVGGKSVYVKLEGITSRTLADPLAHYLVAIPETELEAESGEVVYLRELLGFTVSDEVLGEVGTVSAFSSNEAQDLLVVENKDKETFDIPFVEDFIVELNYDEKRILMSLPEGLLDINRSTEDT